jgi:hypothetical protein
MADGPSTEKHVRYGDAHVPGEVFWGIGVENETYLELFDGIDVPPTFLLENQRRERYSVNYWTQFKDGAISAALGAWVIRSQSIRLALLLNGHTLSRCDRWGEHRTTYTSIPGPNPRFNGKTLLEELEAWEPAVWTTGSQGGERDHTWCFDGDTVEFMTQGFRNTTVEDVWIELMNTKYRWLASLRRFLAANTQRVERLLRGPVGFPSTNYGFAVFLTNRRNVAIFNNGTFHLNLTAPTALDKNGSIADWPRFRRVHQLAARLFQWISPLLVARFGAADPFANLEGVDDALRAGFPAGSQRLAASRYVSVGTYDTRTMIEGKLLTRPHAEMPAASWWREMYARRPYAAYVQLADIGFDINFHKFPNHGLEFRIFDWVPEFHLLEILYVCVWLLDQAVRLEGAGADVGMPQESHAWRRFLGDCVWEGAGALQPVANLWAFPPFRIYTKAYMPALDIWDVLRDRIQADLSTYKGPCLSRFLRRGAQPLVPVMPPLTHIHESTPLQRLHVRDVVRVRLLRPETTLFKPSRGVPSWSEREEIRPHPPPTKQHRRRRWWWRR